MSEHSSSIPPKSVASVGGGLSVAGTLGWIIYMLVQLQAGQARIELRMDAIEKRIPPPRPLVVGSASPQSP